MMRNHAARFNNNGTDFTGIFICRHIKKGSEGGFHFWTCFVCFTVVYLSPVWLSTTRLTGTRQPAFKKPNLHSAIMHNIAFKLRVISSSHCLDLLVCRRGPGSSYATSLQGISLSSKGLALFKLHFCNVLLQHKHSISSF